MQRFFPRSLAWSLWLSTVLIASCSTAPPVGDQFEGVEYPADTGRAHIYIYRSGIRWVSEDSWILALDGLALATVSMDSYVFITIVPGEMEISVDQIRHQNPMDYISSGSVSSDIFTAIETAESARINSEEEYTPLLKRHFAGGETYFYELKDVWRVPGMYPSPSIVEVDETTALEELKKMRLAGPP